MFNIYFKEMKKFFSLIALVGVFAACQPETIETAFTVNGAKATVTVSVVDTEGATLSGYNLTATSTGLAPTVNGNVLTWEAAAGATIAPMTVTVTVSDVPGYYGKFDTVVAVPEILAGGVADMQAKIVVYAENPDNWILSCTLKGEPEVMLDDVKFLENKHYGTYAHDYKHDSGDGFEVEIKTWYVNDSEYILTGEVEYPVKFAADLFYSWCDYEGFYTSVMAFADAYLKEWQMLDTDEKGKLPIKVSAWGMWTAYEKFFSTSQEYVVSAKNTKDNTVIPEVGGFSLIADYCIIAEYLEIGMPTHLVGHVDGHNLVGHISGHNAHTHEHEVTPVYEHFEYAVYSHYHYGHGVEGHGKYNNAGGGIALAE